MARAPAIEAEPPEGDSVHATRIEERRLLLRQALEPILAARTDFVWEIGCGHGHFLTAYAAAHPDGICIGVDLSRDRIERAERKRVRAKLRNLHFLRAEAEDFFAALPAAARFSRLFILFPDPWPKRRHHKNRLLRPDFVERISERAEPGTPLHFRTDHEPYFQAASAVIGASDAWKMADEAWPFEGETVFQQRALRHHSFTARRR